MYPKMITDYFDEVVKKYSNNIGIQEQQRSMTFGEVSIVAKAIATGIINNGLFREPIAIYLDKSIECFNAMLGVIYSGNYYTIVDVDMPMNRVNKIFDILKPKIVITDSTHANNLKEYCYDKVLIENLTNAKIEDVKIENVRKRVIDTDVLYVLFTSGSTGSPKGVIVSHKNVTTYMEWSKKAFGFDNDTVFGSQTPFYFSMSILDVYHTICTGTRLVIIPKKYFSLPGNLSAFIEENKINTIYWVPSALCQVANMNALNTPKLKGIKKVLFAGEKMPAKQLNMWMRALPNAMYANLFGPTEVTDICTYYIVNREISDDESVPIGKACDNMEVFILKEDGTEANGCEEGELYVRGSSVAYGYYANPEKTAEAFVQNPLQNMYPEIVYKTGDLVKYNESGELIYISRKDFQIKHMGYRIELGEIETVASAIDGVERVCVLYNTLESKIILFYTGSIDKKELKNQIKLSVPKYMIPNKYVLLENMPLNLNGKIDRGHLKGLM